MNERGSILVQDSPPPPINHPVAEESEYRAQRTNGRSSFDPDQRPHVASETHLNGNHDRANGLGGRSNSFDDTVTIKPIPAESVFKPRPEPVANKARPHIPASASMFVGSPQPPTTMRPAKQPEGPKPPGTLRPKPPTTAPPEVRIVKFTLLTSLLEWSY
jgi:hypothetical protein